MSKRAISGKITTRDAHETALQPEKPLFLLTSPLRRQNMPKMRENPKKIGLTAKFLRFSEHFFDLQTLRAGKQPRISTMGSNLRPTTCRLCTPYRSLHTYLVQSVGRGLTPDVGIINTAYK